MVRAHRLLSAYTLPRPCLHHGDVIQYASRSHCLDHLATLHAHTECLMHAQALHTSCLLHAYIMPTPDLHRDDFRAYRMSACCLAYDCLGPTHFLPTSCRQSAYCLPTVCLLSAYCLHLGITVHVMPKCLPTVCLLSAYVLPTFCLRSAYALPISCLRSSDIMPHPDRLQA